MKNVNCQKKKKLFTVAPQFTENMSIEGIIFCGDITNSFFSGRHNPPYWLDPIPHKSVSISFLIYFYF